MWVAFANAKATHIFPTEVLMYMPYLMIKVLTNNIVSFENRGPGSWNETVLSPRSGPFMQPIRDISETWRTN